MCTLGAYSCKVVMQTCCIVKVNPDWLLQKGRVGGEVEIEGEREHEGGEKKPTYIPGRKLEALMTAICTCILVTLIRYT